MKRIPKYLYGWKLYVNYGGGWEYETFETSYADYKTNRKAYAENCSYPQRWSKGRETNPAFEESRKLAGVVECIACDSPAELKDYRERNLIVDGYPVCLRHAKMDDLNFWKAVNKKTTHNNKAVPL